MSVAAKGEEYEACLLISTFKTEAAYWMDFQREKKYLTKILPSMWGRRGNVTQ